MRTTAGYAMALCAGLGLSACQMGDRLRLPGVENAVEQAPVAATEAEVQSFFPTGWEAFTVGGRGGAIIRVTTLASDGPGSLREALETKGPRIIVFEVGGVIDLGKSTLVIREPNVTIAGQTAPSPGVTLIRGGIDISTNDVIVQHLRIRPGDAGGTRGSGWAEDAISTQNADGVIVDHCSLTWATDENLSASGPRFTGSTPEEWRAGTSQRLLYSHNIIAEGLADSTHPKFEHSKGSLIHDNITGIVIYANLYAHNYERSPLFKGGVHGAVVNNLIYNPGRRAIHYNLQAQEWGDTPFETGRMTVLGNVMRAGPSTAKGVPMVMLGGNGDLALHLRDNIAMDQWGEPLREIGRYTSVSARVVPLRTAEGVPEGLPVRRAATVERYVLKNAGARPWDRDSHDVRVVADTAEGRGEIIDSQDEVGGYPQHKETRRAFDPALWDLNTMTPASPAALDAGASARGT